jgi:hypothetical protein
MSKANSKTATASMDALTSVVTSMGQEAAVAQQAVDAAITRVNELLRYASAKQDEAADTIFSVAYNDHERALSKEGPPSPQMVLFEAEAGGRLEMDVTTLRKAVKVGALNHRFGRSGAWTKLSYSMKTTLLPLLGDENDFGRLQHGVVAASRPGMTIRAMRDWVTKRLEDDLVTPPNAEPPSPSLAATAKAFEVGQLLGSIPQRNRWIMRVLQLPAVERKNQLAQLKEVLDNLTETAKSLEAAMAVLPS